MTTGNQQFSNLASALLAANMTNVTTSCQVAGGFGAEFPSPTGSQYFMIAVEDTTGNVEIMKCTSRTADVLTVVRAQESTTALAFTANLAVVELRETAGTFGNFLQKSGDTMAGDLNMGTHNVTNAVITTGSSIENAVEIVNTPLRGATGITTNEIDVPSDGSRATAGGLPIVVQGDPAVPPPVGVIQLYFGAAANVNVGALLGWHICDGGTYNTHVTPDLRDQFVIGAGGAISGVVGAIGARNYSTSAVSAGTPVINSIVLATANIPAHRHGSTIYAGSSGQVVGPLGTSAGSDFFFGGVGAGTRIDWQTDGGQSMASVALTTPATGFTPTASALATHMHTVVGDSAYGIFYIMYTG